MLLLAKLKTAMVFCFFVVFFYTVKQLLLIREIKRYFRGKISRKEKRNDLEKLTALRSCHPIIQVLAHDMSYISSDNGL